MIRFISNKYLTILLLSISFGSMHAHIISSDENLNVNVERIQDIENRYSLDSASM